MNADDGLGLGILNGCLLGLPFWFALPIAVGYHAYWSATAIFVLGEIAAYCILQTEEPGTVPSRWK